MNTDLLLIAAVLNKRELKFTGHRSFDKSALGKTARTYLDAIMQHFEDHGEVPSLTLFQSWFPKYEHQLVEDSIPALLKELEARSLRTLLEDIGLNLVDAVKDDVWEARDALLAAAEQVALKNQDADPDFYLGQDIEQVVETQHKIREGGGLSGMPWPWEFFNDATGGIQPGDIIYVYGRQKNKKTWILLYIALYLWSRGYKVLFFTREMSPEKLAWRAYCIFMKLDYDAYKRGDLVRTKEQEEDMLAVGDVLFQSKRFIISSVRNGLMGFKSKVMEHTPDIFIHDYIKGIADDLMGDRVGSQDRYVARAVDQVVDFASSDRIKIPGIICGHANRKGVGSKGKGSDEHAWSDHITRRVNLALRIMTGEGYPIALAVNEGRDVRDDLIWSVGGKLCETLGDFLHEGADWLDEMYAGEKAKEEESNTKSESAPEAAEDAPKPVRRRKRLTPEAKQNQLKGGGLVINISDYGTPDDKDTDDDGDSSGD